MKNSGSLAAVYPLYQQIKGLIIERIVAGEWKPGEPLPSENEFADYYQVSQGTVRKAISEMALENLVERFRGKGTFVKSQTDEREHSHFFNMYGHDGVKILPGARAIFCARGKAGAPEKKWLGLKKGQPVIIAERLRLIKGKPAIFETITVAEERFPSLCSLISDDVPNELYPLYESQFNTRILRAVERLSAVAANDREAEYLELPRGTPLLEINRVAMTFDEEPVEWRRSHCHTKNQVYLSILY